MHKVDQLIASVLVLLELENSPNLIHVHVRPPFFAFHYGVKVKARDATPHYVPEEFG